MKFKLPSFLFITLTAIAFLWSCRDIADYDLWWHMATGRWIFENQNFISTEVFSFTSHGAPYIDMTWLYDLFLYASYAVTGGNFSLIVVAHALLAAGSVAFSWLTFQKQNTSQEKSDFWLAAIFFIAAMWILELRWNHRVEMVSYFYLSAMLYLLSRAWELKKQGQSDKWIYFSLILQIFWTNSHGLFLFGPLLIGSYLVSDFYTYRKIRSSFLWPFLLAIGACFINPYGITGALWPLHLLNVLRDPFYHLTIEETRNPFSDNIWLRDAKGLMAWLILLGFQIVYLLFSKRLKEFVNRFGIGYFVAVVALVWLSITARRNISILVIWTLPFVCDLTCEILALRIFALQRYVSPIRLLAVCAIAFMFFGIGTNVISDDNSATRFGFGTRGSRFPHEAIEFLKKNFPEARLFSDVQFANYAIFELPGFQSYIDSRYAEAYTIDHLKRYLTILGNPSLIESETSQLNIDSIVLTFDPESQPLINYLIAHDTYRMVYYDESAVIFNRTSRLPTWLAKDGKPDLNFTQSFARISNKIKNPNVFDKLSLKYESNDRIWPLVQLSEGSLLVTNFNEAQTSVALAMQLAPKNQSVLNTNCEVQYYNFINQEKKDLIATDHQVTALQVEAACGNALASQPNNVNLLDYLSFIKIKLGLPLQAVEILKKILSINPFNYEALLRLGILESELGQNIEAVAVLERAQNIKPDSRVLKKIEQLKLAR